MSMYYMTWGRGVYQTSYDFQKPDDFDNKRSNVLNSSFIFLFFRSDEEFIESKPSMREQIHECVSIEQRTHWSFISLSSRFLHIIFYVR